MNIKISTTFTTSMRGVAPPIPSQFRITALALDVALTTSGAKQFDLDYQSMVV
jgi:hypothetical protein